MSAHRGGWLGGLADEAERYISGRIDRLAESVGRQADRLAESAADQFARHLVDQFAQRLAARLVWAAGAVGALVVAVWLLAAGAAGALGEVFGRIWLGQLAAGGLVLIAALAAGGIARSQLRRRPDVEPTAPAAAIASTRAPNSGAGAATATAGLPGAPSPPTVAAGADVFRRHPFTSAVAISAAGLVAGSLLARSNGRSRRDD